MHNNIFALGAWLAMASTYSIVTAQNQDHLTYDHHVHVLSPRLVADWKSLGMEFSRGDESYTDANLILRQNESAGAFLISMAHLYSTEDFRAICTSGELERRLVAAENDYIAVSVARHPAKLVGFFSVNIFRDYAVEEFARCQANPNLTGLKLHLPACDFDLENEEHWKQLSEILSLAARENVPVLLHLSAGEELDLRQTAWFWENVIEPHPRLELYLAHLGSAGGFNTSSENLLLGYHLRCTESLVLRDMHVYFDLSGAIIGDNPEFPRTTPERCHRLAELVFKIGVKRFLFASDYPVFSVSETRTNLIQRLGLPAEELTALLSNRSRLFGTLPESSHDAEQEREHTPE